MLCVEIGAALIPAAARAQDVPAEAIPDVAPSAERPLSMSNDEARAQLAAPFPADAPLAERINFLVRQRAAARILGEYATAFRVLQQLTELGKGSPTWSRWMFDWMTIEYTFGSQQQSFELGERLLASPDLTAEFRANAASRLTWMYCAAHDLLNCERTYAKAQQAYAALPPNLSEIIRSYELVHLLEAKSQVMARRGDLDADTQALREAVIESRRNAQRILNAVGGDSQAANYRGALVFAEYAAGQLTYGLLRQGRSVEALAVAEEGLARTRLQGLGPDSIGGWHHRLAAALLALRRYEEALVSARASLAELQRAGATESGQQIGLARNAEITALMSLERWAEADATYGAFLQRIRADKAAYDLASDARLTALLAAKNNRIDAGLQVIDTNVRFRQRLYGLKHPYTLESRGVRGAIHLLNNAPAAALADYDDFFTALLDTSSSWIDLEPVGRRAQYLNIALAEFLNYAARQYYAGGQDAVDRRVFERLVQVTDRMASGVTQRSILESAAKVRNGDPALTALLAREQAQRLQVRDAYRAIAEALAADNKDATADQRKALREKLQKQRDAADAAQKQLEDVRREMASKFPDFIALVNPVNPSMDAIQKVLTSGEAFVAVYPNRQGTFVWAVNANGKRALHISKWTESDVSRRVAAMRATLDVGDRLPKIPPADLALALEMYNELLRPVRSALEGATVLNISAGGALASLPFATLVTAPAQDPRSPAWLVRDFAIAQTPGAAAFVALRRGEARQPAAKSLIGFGDPQFRRDASTPAHAPAAGANASPKHARNLVVAANAQQASTYSVETGFRYAGIPSLPETRDELIALASALGADAQKDLVLGAEATRRAVLSTPLADRRVVAFATHGLLPGEIPGLSKPALAMAASDDPSESPLLTLDDVLTLRLNSQWVVLSACNTAGGERDGVAMSGLVRGFFFAGTRSVLATHWAVESEASRQLVSFVFSDYAKDARGGRAASLRRAQLAMIDGTLGNGSYAHPFYWAPYALFGDPTR